ncbi:hypothetical protein ACT96B_004807, partial [Escherichia coli]
MSGFLGCVINLKLISMLHYVFVLTQAPINRVTAYICSALYGTNKKIKYTKAKKKIFVKIYKKSKNQ